MLPATLSEPMTLSSWLVDQESGARVPVTLAADDLYVVPGNPGKLLAGLAGPRLYITNTQFHALEPPMNGRAFADAPEHELAGALQAFVTLNNAIRFAEAAYGETIDFSAGSSTAKLFLEVQNGYPEAYGDQLKFGGPTPLVVFWRSWGWGSQFEADRRSMNMGWVAAGESGKPVPVDTGLSRQIPVHELMHALTFGLRGDWTKPHILRDAETRAIQEGIADFLASAALLQDEHVLRRIESDHGGDLRKAHFVADFAHWFYRLQPPSAFPLQLRTSINSFKRSDADLDQNARGSMGSVAHPTRFIDLVSGTFLDMTAALSTDLSISDAAFVMTRLILHGLAHPEPDRPMTVESLAQGMLLADQAFHDGQFAGVIRATLRARDFKLVGP